MTTTATSLPPKKGLNIGNRLLNYIKFSIKDRRGVNFTSLIFGVIGLPFLAIVSMVIMRLQYAQYAANSSYTGSSLPVQLGIIGAHTASLQILFVIAFLAVGARHQFSYLFDRMKVDMKYSLPLTERERFYGDFIAGGIVPFAVYAVSGLLSVIIFLGGTAGIPNPDADYQTIRNLVFSCYAQGLLLCLFFYTFMVAVKTLCGRRTESAICPLIFAVLIPGIIYTGAVLSFSNTAGAYTDNIAAYAVNAGGVLSPFGYVVYVGAIMSGNLNYGNDPFMSSPLTPILAIVMTIALFFFARSMYGKRRNEHVGQPFVFKHVYTVLLLTCVLGVCMLFFSIFYGTTEYGNRSEYMFAFLAAQVIITAVIFFISYGIKCGGIKKSNIGRGIKLYLCVFAASLVISNLLPLTDGFGLTKTLPHASGIQSVTVKPGYNKLALYADVTGSGDGSKIEFKNVENIDAAIMAARTYIQANVKKSYVSSYAMSERYNATKQPEAFTKVEFDFLLKNGRHVLRSYVVSRDNLDPLYNLFWTDEAKQSYLDRTTRPYLINRNTEEYTYSYTGILKNIYDSYGNNRVVLTNEQTERLLEAHRADVLAKTRDGMTKESAENKVATQFEVTTKQTYVIGTSTTSSDNVTYLTILEGDVNFMKTLKELGIEIPDSYPVEGSTIYLSYRDNIGEIPIYFEYSRGADFVVPQSRVEHRGEVSAQIPVNDPVLQKLMSVAQPECAVNGAGFVIYGGYSDLIIPPQYEDMARELLSRYLLAEEAFTNP